MARQGLFLKKECTSQYTTDLKITLNAAIGNKPTLNKHQVTLLNSGSALNAFETNSEIDDLLEPAVNKLEFTKRQMQRKKKYDANTYEVKFVSIDDIKLSETSLARKLSFNLYKNFIKEEMSPVINNIIDLAKANFVIGSTAVIAEAGLAAQAMNASTKLLMGKAFLGGTQGLFGAWAAGGNKVYILSGGLIGGVLGAYNIPSKIPLSLSGSTELMIEAGVSNFSGQIISKVRSPDNTHFDLLSLALSSWGGSVAGYLTKDISIGLTKTVIESTIQTPIDAIGSHIGRQ